ncbi:MAG: universal stress protein [Leptolyngbya sp.]|nr:universal stress protein [Leptolyngbya sp.]
MFKRILVAVDCESTTAHQVLAEAQDMALAHQADLQLVHVLSPVSLGYLDPSYMTLDGALNTINPQNYEAHLATWEEIKQRTQDRLNADLTAARRQGIATTATQLVGDPGKALCALARDWSADLLVVGRRGILGLGEMILGSVSNYVLHHAPCAVLVVQGGKIQA